METFVPEIPQVDIPDEITHVNLPEVEETTPHPQTPNPQAGQADEQKATWSLETPDDNRKTIGFQS